MGGAERRTRGTAALFIPVPPRRLIEQRADRIAPFREIVLDQSLDTLDVAAS